MKVDAIVGLQWGDEGKGKIVDYLATDYDLVCRFQGGPNAGHTLKINQKKYVLHTVPSGIFRKHLINVIGNGVVIDPITLQKELLGLEAANVDYQDRLLVSRKAHLILPTHRMLDAASEASKGSKKIGSTLRGIGPTYMDKTGRNGLRVGDILLPDFMDRYQQLKQKHLHLIRLYPEISFDLDQEEKKWLASIEVLSGLKTINGAYYINNALKENKRVLAEGAQGSMLDIDFGTYPFVTSSNTITSGICNGLGVAPKNIGKIIGITKAYCTRVGSGPFPTELHGQTGEELRKAGHEFGATTGRSRRCGWIDLPQLKYTIMLNGVDELALTKVDVLNSFSAIQAAYAYQTFEGITDEVPFSLESDLKPIYDTIEGWEQDLDQCIKWDELPGKVIDYVKYIEKKLNVPIKYLSTGPEREKLIIQNHPSLVY